MNLHRGRANLLFIVPVLAYVLPKQVRGLSFIWPNVYLGSPRLFLPMILNLVDKSSYKKGSRLSKKKKIAPWERPLKMNPLNESKINGRSSLVAQQVKDPALSLLQLRWLLWCGFDPWPRFFCMPWVWPKRKKNIVGEFLSWRSG